VEKEGEERSDAELDSREKRCFVLKGMNDV
jgi:hypothetical protein